MRAQWGVHIGAVVCDADGSVFRIERIEIHKQEPVAVLVPAELWGAQEAAVEFVPVREIAVQED